MQDRINRYLNKIEIRGCFLTMGYVKTSNPLLEEVVCRADGQVACTPLCAINKEHFKLLWAMFNWNLLFQFTNTCSGFLGLKLIVGYYNSIANWKKTVSVLLFNPPTAPPFFECMSCRPLCPAPIVEYNQMKTVSKNLNQA